MQPESNRASTKSLPQKNLLVVDDDPSILRYLEMGFSVYPGLKVITALNGVMALEQLEAHPVDLVITDIQMPEMDGLTLVSQLSRKSPRLPIIVVTAHGTDGISEALSRVGIVSYFKKPFVLDALAERVFDLLAGVEAGYVSGISVASFLQLLHAENKTCCLRITCQGRVGMLHFVNGEIWDATVDERAGVRAALEIVSWDGDLSIDIQNLVRLKERTIDMDVTYLVMEAFRRKDEASIRPGTEISDPPMFVLPERGSIHPEVLEEDKRVCPNVGLPLPGQLSSRQQFLLFESLMKLRDIPGYKVGVLLTHEGEILASHSVVSDAAVDLMAKGIQELFVQSGEKGRALGLASLEETVFRTASGVVMFRCSAGADLPHVHLFAVTQDFSAEALLRMRMKRVLEEAMLKAVDMLESR